MTNEKEQFTSDAYLVPILTIPYQFPLLYSLRIILLLRYLPNTVAGYVYQLKESSSQFQNCLLCNLCILNDAKLYLIMLHLKLK